MGTFSFTLLVLQVMLISLADGSGTDWKKMAQDDLKATLAMAPNTRKAKNIIFFLGDGMGVTTVTSARIAKGQGLNPRQPGEETVLSFDAFPYLGLLKTYSNDKQTPDSGATSTAMLAGEKTNDRTIGVNDKAVNKNCSTEAPNVIKTIVELFQEDGRSTGVVSTARLTHATPAAAYAHTVERGWESFNNLPEDAKGTCKDIAEQLIDNGKFNVMLGGGRSRFLPTSVTDPEYSDKTGDRNDGRNLVDEWKANRTAANQQFSYVWKKTDFDAVDTTAKDYLLGLFERSHMQYNLDRGSDGSGEPSLEEMTEKAINILKKNTNGYFLFVEGARIDHGHHASQPKRALDETLQMEAAVKKAVDMTVADNSADDTLIIVTADHSHSNTLGGYADRGNDIYGVTDKGYAKDNMPYTSILYSNGPGFDKSQPNGRQNLTGVDTTATDYVSQSAVPLDDATHSGEDVPVFAKGPMAHLFHHTHEQHFVYHVMAYASCLGDNKDHCTVTTTTSTTPTEPNLDNKAATALQHSLLFMLMTLTSTLICVL